MLKVLRIYTMQAATLNAYLRCVVKNRTVARSHGVSANQPIITPFFGNETPSLDVSRTF